VRGDNVRAASLLGGIVLGLWSLSLQAQAACNIRGEFCGYPGWAANAFSHPFDRVPDTWLDHPTNPPTYGYADRTQEKKRYRKRYRDRR
jgi:hypothetical protein